MPSLCRTASDKSWVWRPGNEVNTDCTVLAASKARVRVVSEPDSESGSKTRVRANLLHKVYGNKVRIL